MKKLLIRADASNEIGIGHIMRCLALAQEWISQGGAVYLFSFDLPKDLEKLLLEEQIEIINEKDVAPGSIRDANETIKQLKKFEIDILVIDGYYFNSEFQKEIKNHSHKILLFDDFGQCDIYYADYVINRGFFANSVDYSNRMDYTQVLLGHKYALLRKDFLANKLENKITAEIPTKILITMGGSDKENIVLLILNALLEMELNQTFQVRVILGPLNKNKSIITDFQNKCTYGIEIITSSNQMYDHFNWADLGITSGGTTLIEMLYMGLPTISIKTASNQRALKVISEDFNATTYLGESGNINPELISREVMNLLNDTKKREELIRNGQKLIDGLGTKRIVQLIKE
ncbi:UDP-2,4-diacetamido-2,4,6-trideoxy-beta-L-altropyranose hydrolase [Rossellomorea aquimaris]|uniref:UDP-2,4-diacetamido-2,4, 6-trideoxy-beta-L-altropyranose hydrolase n=1 Tax=Rossellomorea aquimaris TaxID=189382 RepID=UPI001CD6520A|nr:UDP-2,4-diacetamido-2,4,6-trideoxy-beta-L-altropyranose hydrolase [Rossellomorea aquimaris]MCA1055305.1 UDP-2,4-diacetamido-2,4,6-trideoxy-beta-L-altropyranose hydrolase [Rossellomorea aquimaris]